MKIPEVGQIVYSLNIGDEARDGKQELTPYEVTKVGRKYFTIKLDWREIQFHLKDWREKSNYSPNHKLYTTEQEYYDYKESVDICSEINKAFEYGRNTKNLSLEALQEIKKYI